MIRKIALGASFLAIFTIFIQAPLAFAQIEIPPPLPFPIPEPEPPCFDFTALDGSIEFLESSPITGARDAAQDLRDVRDDIVELGLLPCAPPPG